MASRGDVLVLKRRMGFGAPPEGERVVVLQDDRLNAVRPTAIVAPLDVATSFFAGSPTAIPVSSAEAATPTAMVALVANLHCLAWDRLAPGAVGRLQPATLARIDTMLRFVLGLR